MTETGRMRLAVVAHWIVCAAGVAWILTAWTRMGPALHASGPWVAFLAPVVWSACIAALAFAHRLSALPLAVYPVFSFWLPRYSGLHQASLEWHFLDVFTIVALSGWLVSGRWRETPWTFWLLRLTLALFVWIGLSTACLWVTAGSWVPASTHHPGRFATACVLLLLASSVTSVERGTALVAAAMGATLLTRAWVFPLALNGDEDLASLCAIAWPLLLGTAFVTRTRTARVGAVLATCATAYVMASTGNRGAMVGSAAALLLILALQVRIRHAVLISVAAALAGLAYARSTFSSRFLELWHAGLQAGSAGDRLQIWTVALSIARDHLWLGVGIGNFGNTVPRYAPGMGHPSPHNNAIAFLTEAGVIGLVLYVALFGSGIAALAARSRRRSTGSTRVALWLAASLVAYVGAGFFITRHTEPLAYLLVGLGISALTLRDVAGAREIVNA